MDGVQTTFVCGGGGGGGLLFFNTAWWPSITKNRIDESPNSFMVL